MAGKKVYTTEMWDPHDPLHTETFDNPDIFQFMKISQNDHQSSDKHWKNGSRKIKRLEKIEAIRSVNNVKIYGNDEGAHKSTYDAIENFVTNNLMDCASARFHRPSSGQELNEPAQRG